MKKFIWLFFLIFIVSAFILSCNKKENSMKRVELNTEKVISSLVEKYGDEQKDRIRKGVIQVAQRWREEDGDQTQFEKFCEEQFIADDEILRKTFLRFDHNLEQIDGLNHEMQRTLQEPMHLDIGPMLPVDMLFASYDPFAHVSEDLFKTKVAFTALLNFPLYSLKERLELGPNWTREQWAQMRLAQRFESRVPGKIKQKISSALVEADNYISNYNIYMHNLLTPEGKRLFPEGLKLITHWGLRDELKAQYAKKDGLPRQRMIKKVMENIIQQTIPSEVINSEKYDWDPEKNVIFEAGTGNQTAAHAEENVRYQRLLDIFRAETKADAYYPDTPTFIQRKFDTEREIPEEEFEKLLVSVVSSPVAKKVAALIERRLGRPLEAFDIWYDGFKSRGVYSEDYLDQIVGKRYPTVEAFQNDLPYILRNLGFSPQKAAFLSSKIAVDPSRGAGHAWGAERREDKAHLRTRIPATGMKYKGFNIAIHELGHCVEQVFSLNEMDYVLLQGVPNTAFTEAFAFVFQSRDLQLLGLTNKNAEAEYLKALDAFWSTYEIAGVGLVDMRIWRWMYDHPQATPEELKAATIQIAKDVWNEFYAPVFGIKDQILLAIYSHIIDAELYTPDYSLGQIIMFQIENYLRGKNLGKEMERMCKLGSITPNEWMKQAVGSEISAQALISAAEEAVAKIGT